MSSGVNSGSLVFENSFRSCWVVAGPATAPIPEAPLDLAGCEPPDLARPDAVQAGVHVVLLDPRSLRVLALSAGCRALTDQPLDRCLAQSLAGLLAESSADEVSRLLISHPGHPLALSVTSRRGEPCWVSRFNSEGRIGLLVEPLPSTAPSAPADWDPALKALMAGVGHLNGGPVGGGDGLEGFCQRMADLMREVIGFQRVMVYRFDPDWNGTVIAESRLAGVASSYRGLTFPASDIPPQARELFQLTAVRPTIDVEAEPEPLLYAEGEAGSADLGACIYRAVADAHRTYLRNMGVRASLTLALTVNGRLWGLVACHHLDGPRRVDPPKLALFRSLSEIFSLALARVVEQEEHSLLERVGHLGQWLQRQITVSRRPDFQADVIQRIKGRLRPLLGCDSVAYRDGERLYRSPGAPSEAAIEAIARFYGSWSRRHGRAVLVTSELQGYGLDLSPADARKAAGVVVVGGTAIAPLLMLFRRPSPLPSTWAGDPDHRVKRVPGSDRLDPRSSFELFVRERRGDSDSWPSVTPRAVLELRDALKQAHWILRSRLDAQELERSHLKAVLAHEEVLHAALHDPLTGLANRRHLYERLRENAQVPLALLHLDLDGFKAVNDTLGHEVGDQLLVQIAEILRDTLRENDLAVRLGGDEFVVLTELAHDRTALEGLARRIIARVSRPHLIQEQVCRLGVSIGIALGNPQDPRASNLLRQSDVALYESKRRGKGCFTVYTPELDAAIREELQLAEELAVALQRDELVVYFQPQFLVESGELVGVEALLRWNHPRLGVLEPSRFLPIARKCGLLGSVDAHALQLIDHTYQRWCAEGIAVQKLSINVSAEQLCCAGFTDQVKALGIPPEVLTLELLESIYLDQPNPSVQAALQELQQLGIRIELDDFGSGHTSVLSLMAVQPNGLKVDKGLVIPALSCVETTRLLRLVVGMGHALEIDVTAEGVESPAHVALVKQLRCRRMQGYGLARPMQPEAFAELAREATVA